MRSPARHPEALRRQRAEQRLRRRAAAATVAGAARASGSLRIELRFAGQQPVPSTQVHVLHGAAPAWLEFPCPCTDCDGAFDLGAAIARSLGARGRRVTGRIDCGGTRPAPQLTRTPCGLAVDFTVSGTFTDRH